MSVPILEVALVLSLFFAIPVASVTIEVVSMMQSRGHGHLSWRVMVDTIVRTPQGDLLKREQAARLRREVFEAIDTLPATELPGFLTADPHVGGFETADPHDDSRGR